MIQAQNTSLDRSIERIRQIYAKTTREIVSSYLSENEVVLSRKFSPHDVAGKQSKFNAVACKSRPYKCSVCNIGFRFQVRGFMLKMIVSIR